MKIPVIQGTIDRRILVDFRVDPMVLAKLLSSPFRPKLVNGAGMAGVCLIRLQHLRPRFVPKAFGIGSEIEVKIFDGKGKVLKTTDGGRKTLEGSGFVMWTGSWELFDLPPGIYTIEVAALDKEGKVVTARTEKILHGNPAESINPKP